MQSWGMQSERLENFVETALQPCGVVSISEYRKGMLVIAILLKTRGFVDSQTFGQFMDKADLLEKSIYERLKVEAAQYDWQGVNEAWLRTETFNEMKKSLSDLPVFSNS